MTAEEARNLASQGSPELEKVLEDIKLNAKDGRFHSFFEYLNPTIIQALMNDGFAIKKHTDPLSGTSGFVISWF
jgi:hypothetical protein